MKTPRENRRQAGQATLEYLYVLPILLILLLGALQFVFIYQAKQTLNYAAFVGTRAGALHNGDIAFIVDGVAGGLAPLYVHDRTQKALKDARRLAKRELGDEKLALVTILNPDSSTVGSFGGEVPNDNLMYRDPDDIKGSVNVQDANLLKVRVTYCVRLVVPLVNRMIYAFTSAPPPTPDKIDTLSSNASGKLSSGVTATDFIKAKAGASTGLCVSPDDPYPYRIAVTSEAVVRMQTPFTGTAWTSP